VIKGRICNRAVIHGDKNLDCIEDKTNDDQHFKQVQLLYITYNSLLCEN